MKMTPFSWAILEHAPIVGIMRNIPIQDVAEILSGYLEAGLTTVEVTMNSPDAGAIIRYATNQYSGKLNVGAGTVCNLADLEKALGSGAQFIVTPVLDEQVIEACVQERVPIFPGAYTPSEIYRAWKLGASMVKVFPAATLGSSYLKDLKGPLNEIKLMPTGGINLHNCTDFLNAGAASIGVGGQLFDEKSIVAKDWKTLKGNFKKFINKINTRK